MAPTMKNLNRAAHSCGAVSTHVTRRICTVLAFLCIVGIPAFAVTAAPTVAAPAITVTDVGQPMGSLFSFGGGISDSGTVVGSSVFSDKLRGYAFINGVRTDLGTLGGSSSTAVAVNLYDQVVGNSTTTDGSLHSYIWSASTGMTDLGSLSGGGGHVDVGSINDYGQVVGVSDVADSSGIAWHAFLWTSSGGMEDLGILPGGGDFSAASGINNLGQVVGLATTSAGFGHAFLYSNGTMSDLGTLGGATSGALDINDGGVVVGVADTATGDQHAFMWRNGAMSDLGTLGGTFSKAFSVNNRGMVVGESTTASGETHAFMWYKGVMTDLTNLVGTSTSYLTSVRGINSSGQMAGSAAFATGFHGCLISGVKP